MAFKLGHCVAYVIVGERRNQVKAANDGVELIGTGRSLCLLYGVQNTAMAAGGQHHQATTLDDVAGRNLMLKATAGFSLVSGGRHVTERAAVRVKPR
jgi:hypothetical protein